MRITHLIVNIDTIEIVLFHKICDISRYLSGSLTLRLTRWPIIAAKYGN